MHYYVYSRIKISQSRRLSPFYGSYSLKIVVTNHEYIHISHILNKSEGFHRTRHDR